MLRVQLLMLAASVCSCCPTHDPLHIQRDGYPGRPVTDGKDEYKCVMNATQRCPLAVLPGDKPSLIYPGGATRCIFSHSSPYSFQVMPGDTAKVLVYFQGGGTCWDKQSSCPLLPLCTTSAEPAPLTGLFDRKTDANPYRNHTLLHILYCSGDAHAGNVTRAYTDLAGVPVQQRGFYNTRAALDWLRANVGSQLSELVLTGCSAGSIGAQTWANVIFNEFEAKSKALLADSFAGFFPPHSQGVTIRGYGMCELPLIPHQLKPACRVANLTLQDYVGLSIATHSSIPFGFINSKQDHVQRTYYSLIAGSFHDKPLLPPTAYYQGVNGIFEKYYHDHPNVVTFIVTGKQHCFTPYTFLYESDASGKHGHGREGRTKLVDWLRDGIPLQPGRHISSQCTGSLQPNGYKGAAYCDERLGNRTWPTIPWTQGSTST